MNRLITILFGFILAVATSAALADRDRGNHRGYDNGNHHGYAWGRDEDKRRGRGRDRHDDDDDDDYDDYDDYDDDDRRGNGYGHCKARGKGHHKGKHRGWDDDEADCEDNKPPVEPTCVEDVARTELTGSFRVRTEINFVFYTVDIPGTDQIEYMGQVCSETGDQAYAVDEFISFDFFTTLIDPETLEPFTWDTTIDLKCTVDQSSISGRMEDLDAGTFWYDITVIKICDLDGGPPA